jgi:cell wall-associated NlpC family hydrolase
MRAETRSNFIKVGCVALALLLLVPTTEARSRRYHRRSAVVVALQPFLLARSAVHAIADPSVYEAPRVITRAAVAPLRIAYQTGHSRVARGEIVDENEGEPTQVAYYTSRVRPQQPPRAQAVEASDDDDQPRQARTSSDFTGESESGPVVPGGRAILRNGIAVPPANAPANVKNAILATNSLRRKPYIWGGGHGSFNDRGYDCSGTVSFALHHAGLLSAPLPSSDLMHYGERGRGRWITIYTRPGHTFATIAGLRLDTTDFRIGGNVGPRWHADMRDTRGYVVRHPAGL